MKSCPDIRILLSLLALRIAYIYIFFYIAPGQHKITLASSRISIPTNQPKGCSLDGFLWEEVQSLLCDRAMEKAPGHCWLKHPFNDRHQQSSALHEQARKCHSSSLMQRGDLSGELVCFPTESQYLWFISSASEIHSQVLLANISHGVWSGRSRVWSLCLPWINGIGYSNAIRFSLLFFVMLQSKTNYVGFHGNAELGCIKAWLLPRLAAVFDCQCLYSLL